MCQAVSGSSEAPSLTVEDAEFLMFADNFRYHKISSRLAQKKQNRGEHRLDASGAGYQLTSPTFISIAYMLTHQGKKKTRAPDSTKKYVTDT
jgi:hypothetical protein